MKQDLLAKLENINERSQKNCYSIEDLDWSVPINPKINWVPEEMNYISYLPSYKNLTEKQRLRLNQLYAMSICEQFVWLENNLLAGILTDGFQNENLPPAFRQSMNTFYTEEEKHSEMFWRVLEKSEPTWYENDRTFKIFRTNKIQDFFFDTITKYNKTFLVWIWLALFFEERTLDFSKKYQRAYQDDKSGLDFNFWQVHFFHMKDEVRHHQMDEIFLTEFYDKASLWKRNICGKMFFKLMKAYIAPKRNAKKILNILESEFPDLQESNISQKLREELPLLEKNCLYQSVVFGKEAIGRTLELMAKYKEFNSIWSLFLNLNKSDFKSEETILKKN